MNRSPRRSPTWMIVALAAATSLAAGACARSQAPTDQPAGAAGDGTAAASPDDQGGGDIVLGFLGSFEGAAADLSDQAQLGAEIAVEELNADGGVLGRQVVLPVKNSTGKPEVAATNARELLAREGAVALIGGGGSAEASAASAVAKEMEVPYLVSIGTSETITVEEGHEWVFQMQSNSGMEGRALSQLAADQGWGSVQILAPDYEWGHTTSSLIASSLQATGDVSVDEPLFFPLGETDFSTYLSRLASEDRDGFVSLAWGGDAISVAKQAKSYNLLDSREVIGYWSLAELQTLGQDAPVGVVGIERGPFYYLAEKYPAAEALVDAYVERSGGEFPTGFTFASYDAVKIWAAAVEEAGTTDAVAVRDALHSVEIDGTRGPISFTEADNQALVPVYFGTVEFTDDYDFAILTDVKEIEAEPLTAEEVEERRQGSSA